MPRLDRALTSECDRGSRECCVHLAQSAPVTDKHGGFSQHSHRPDDGASLNSSTHSQQVVAPA